MSSREQRHRAAIFGCGATELTPDERRFFGDANPLGFILFQRNCGDPEQVRALVADLRSTVGRADTPVLIDQEGGRVARLKPPYWQTLPPARAIGLLYEAEPERGLEAAWLAARIAAADLAASGVSANCLPVLDVLDPHAESSIIGDRSYGSDPRTVVALGRRAIEGSLAGGVLPIVKHIPGHGRANADSHFELPVVRAEADDLDTVDLVPFKALAGAPIAMTAHVLYPAWDGTDPATVSRRVVREIIRDAIGFDGLLLTDDISMQALRGSLAERSEASLAAGCDIVLHCNGRLEEMAEVAAACPPMTPDAERRWMAAAAALHAPEPFDIEAGTARLQLLLGTAVA